MLGLLEVRLLHELCEDNKFRYHLGCTDLRETIKTDEMHEMCGVHELPTARAA